MTQATDPTDSQSTDGKIKPVVSYTINPSTTQTTKLENTVYNHMYAIWSADEMENGEFEYRYRQVLQVIQSEASRIALEAIDSYVQDLKDTARDYCKKYPDADINDFIGLIVGVRNQPQRIASLTAPEGGTQHD